MNVYPRNPMKMFLWCQLIGFSTVLFAGESMPAPVVDFLKQHCFECHAGREDKLEGDVNLDLRSVDWASTDSLELWTTVHEVVHSGEMPPRDAESIPGSVDRDTFLAWLGEVLTEYSPPGGTLPRRLNRIEYLNTIRNLFDYPEFELPPSFPSDVSKFGFDNVASGLVISPPLLAQYLEIATAIADEFLPQPVTLPKAEPHHYSIDAMGLNTDEGGGGALAGEVFRLVSSRNMASAAGWTSSFEAPISGIYSVRIDARVFQTGSMFYERRSKPFLLQVFARQNGEQKYAKFSDMRMLGEVSISTSEAKHSVDPLEVELFQGEIMGFRWADGPVYSDPGRIDLSHDFIDDRLLNDPIFYAAALKLNGGKRGSSQAEFYEAICALMESGDLDLSDPALGKPPAVYGGGLFNGPHNWCKAYAHEQMHRFGPALDILEVAVNGPNRVVISQTMRDRLARSKAFLGRQASESTDILFVERFLRDFLSRAFRRPVSDDQLGGYMELVCTHRDEFPEKRIEDALHLAIRKALLSPHFLFRELGGGALDEYELASRLSYFLNGSPPDAELTALASSGQLSKLDVLGKETRRLLSKPERLEFVKHFTGQWLGTRMLKDIMPDPRLLKFFNPDRDALIEETELFFEELLAGNYTLDHFIDPGFSFRNQNLNKIYGGDLTGKKMQRVTFPKGGRQGGLLGLASIMMATANGVDTHPVHRGVWLLENVLGQPTPPPPADVPAVAPDTSGATTMRELMLKHQADAACARCHEKIDPLGFVMEQFDPVGRWREYYPIYTDGASEKLKEEFYSSQGEGTRLGRRIDTSATMPGGTLLNDVTDLKAYLMNNMELFASCLIEKLLIYSTGRELSFGDHRIVQSLTNDVLDGDRGFQDLIVSVVLSESFLKR
jgi:hypothetical protein